MKEQKCIHQVTMNELSIRVNQPDHPWQLSETRSSDQTPY